MIEEIIHFLQFLFPLTRAFREKTRACGCEKRTGFGGIREGQVLVLRRSNRNGSRFSDALGSVNLFLKMKAEEYCKQYMPLFLSRTLILKYVLLMVA